MESEAKAGAAAGGWRIRVKRVRGGDFWVHVDEKDGVGGLIEKICKKLSVEEGKDAFFVIWRGKRLRTGSFEEHQISNGCCVHLLRSRVNRRRATANQRPPRCLNGHEMKLSSFSGGGYVAGWVCDRCGRPGVGARWLCMECRCDYCQVCPQIPNAHEASTNSAAAESLRTVNAAPVRIQAPPPHAAFSHHVRVNGQPRQQRRIQQQILPQGMRNGPPRSPPSMAFSQHQPNPRMPQVQGNLANADQRLRQVQHLLNGMHEQAMFQLTQMPQAQRGLNAINRGDRKRRHATPSPSDMNRHSSSRRPGQNAQFTLLELAHMTSQASSALRELSVNLISVSRDFQYLSNQSSRGDVKDVDLALAMDHARRIGKSLVRMGPKVSQVGTILYKGNPVVSRRTPPRPQADTKRSESKSLMSRAMGTLRNFVYGTTVSSANPAQNRANSALPDNSTQAVIRRMNGSPSGSLAAALYAIPQRSQNRRQDSEEKKSNRTFIRSQSPDSR